MKHTILWCCLIFIRNWSVTLLAAAAAAAAACLPFALYENNPEV